LAADLVGLVVGQAVAGVADDLGFQVRDEPGSPGEDAAGVVQLALLAQQEQGRDADRPQPVVGWGGLSRQPDPVLPAGEHRQPSHLPVVDDTHAKPHGCSAPACRCLVQYYFGTRDQLLLAALGALAKDVAGRIAARIAARLAALGDDPPPRLVVDAILREFLPTDDASRQAMLLIAFHTASLTDPSLARAEALQVPRDLIAVLAEQLRRGQLSRGTAADLDVDKEATVLVTVLTGMATSVLGGIHTTDEAAAILDYQLDRLFPPG
jgi:AcrR family transcriptional regulator